VDPSDHDRNDLNNGAQVGSHEPTHANGSSLEEDHRWLRSVVENSSEIVVVVDPNGTLGYANPAWGRALGYDPRVAIGTMNVLDHVHPDDLRRVEMAFAEGLKDPGRRPSVEYRFRHKDGRWVWLESVGTNLLNDPEVGGYVVNSRDVTGRKEAEGRLREAEERYRTLVEHIPAVTYIDRIDEVSSAIYMSPQVEEMLGYTPEEWLKAPEFWIKILHPDDKERILAEDRRTNETGDPFGVEYRAISKSGHVVWVRDDAVLVRDGEGRPLFWQGILYEITERRRVEEALKESEQRFRSSFDDAAIGMALVAPDGRFLQTNRSLCEILGYPEEELLGKTFQDLTHPEDLDTDLDQVRRMLAAEIRTYQMEKRYLHREGHVVWVLLSVSLVRDEEGEPLYFVSQVQDVSERKRAGEKLREAEEKYRTLVEQIPAVTYIDWADGSDTPLYTSPQIEGMLGYTSEEWRADRLWPKRLHPEDRDRVLAADERFEKEGEERFGAEYRLLAKDGSVVWVREEAVLVEGLGGRSRFWQGVITDITERKVLEERLEYRVVHDPLTHLPNRQLFLDRLAQALRRTRRRRGRSVAVLFMDLDNFKDVNDSLGHEAGDLLLVVVAERLRRCLRSEDTLARFGGDEFVVLLEDVDGPEEAVWAAERLTDQLRYPFVLEGRELYARASIGIALGEDRTKDPADLLRDADTAMYRAKDEGGGFRVFDQVMYERVVQRLELQNDLRRAIEQEEFVVHYQPIMSLQTGEVFAVEALVRWEHPERGLLNPDEFVPVAEESGLVVPMGELVLKEACFRTVGWQRQFPRTLPLAISVNLSARQLSRPDLAETVERVLGETGLEGSCLTLDVTETVYVRALGVNTRVLDRLRTLGVKISIDDFGIGYSSLSYLKKLPADTIKIDKSFVRGLGDDIEDTAIVRMIIELTHTLGMEVVAEGVEAEEQVALLEEMGCDFAQGYFFSRPLPPRAATEALAD
jgi:diguanylate cyclase (GGDEF)-like protein/PAS domain S-box-containing protein